MKKNVKPMPVTLAIGDGANDVGMIQVRAYPHMLARILKNIESRVNPAFLQLLGGAGGTRGHRHQWQ